MFCVSGPCVSRAMKRNANWDHFVANVFKIFFHDKRLHKNRETSLLALLQNTDMKTFALFDRDVHYEWEGSRKCFFGWLLHFRFYKAIIWMCNKCGGLFRYIWKPPSGDRNILVQCLCSMRSFGWFHRENCIRIIKHLAIYYPWLLLDKINEHDRLPIEELEPSRENADLFFFLVNRDPSGLSRYQNILHLHRFLWTFGNPDMDCKNTCASKMHHLADILDGRENLFAVIDKISNGRVLESCAARERFVVVSALQSIITNQRKRTFADKAVPLPGLVLGVIYENSEIILRSLLRKDDARRQEEHVRNLTWYPETFPQVPTSYTYVVRVETQMKSPVPKKDKALKKEAKKKWSYPEQTFQKKKTKRSKQGDTKKKSAQGWLPAKTNNRARSRVMHHRKCPRW
jgi:hypothetical protein